MRTTKEQVKRSQSLAPLLLLQISIVLAVRRYGFLDINWK